MERSLNHKSRNQKFWWAKNQKSFMNRMRAIMKNHWAKNQDKSMSHNSKTKYRYDKRFGKIYEPQKIFHPMNCKNNNVNKKSKTKGLIKWSKTWSERTRNMRELTTWMKECSKQEVPFVILLSNCWPLITNSGAF
jgi:hypothetical protein